MLTLLIARHGNTFDSGDTILRVGKRTDLALSHSGQEQARKLGIFLQETYPTIDHVYVSSLQRTQETAQIALPNMLFEINPMFDEIDYGIDDGKPETEVVARVGEEALKQWEENAVSPPEWKVDAEKIIQGWKDFANNLLASVGVADGRSKAKVILVVTSNGIARFAPYIAKDFETLRQAHALKMKTGAISSFQWTQESDWHWNYWNVSPRGKLV